MSSSSSFEMFSFDYCGYIDDMNSQALVIMRDCVTEVFGKNEYFKGAVAEIYGMKSVIITSTNLNAWIKEFGSGVHMNLWSNFDIDNYRKSSFYNKERDKYNGAILTRGSQRYTQADYASGTGTVTRIGKDPAGKVVSEGLKAQPFIDELAELAINKFSNKVSHNLESSLLDYVYVSTFRGW